MCVCVLYVLVLVLVYFKIAIVQVLAALNSAIITGASSIFCVCLQFSSRGGCNAFNDQSANNRQLFFTMDAGEKRLSRRRERDRARRATETPEQRELRLSARRERGMQL